MICKIDVDCGIHGDLCGFLDLHLCALQCTLLPFCAFNRFAFDLAFDVDGLFLFVYLVDLKVRV